MKLSITLPLAAFAFLTVGQVSAQDAKAKAILDQLSKKNKAYTSIKADFSYNLNNKDQKINETQDGTIFIKGPKYKLNIAGQEVISDGKTVWTYLKDAKEVQLQNPPDPSEEDALNPATIFTLYEKGFKYKFEGENTTAGKTIQTITLHPDDPKNKPYHTIKLEIDKGSQQVHALRVLGKDGNNYTYLIKNFSSNVNLPETTFTFNPAQHPGVDVIDLRE